MKDDLERSPQEIQAGLERTRADLNATLSAIERRLTPEQLLNHGIDYLRHSGAREYVVNLGAAAKQDPLPLALVGVGLGWLMLSGNRRSGRDATADRYIPRSDAPTQTAHDAAARMTGAASSVRDTMSSTVASMRDTVSSVRDSAARTSERVSQTARQGADRVRSGVDYLVHEQPLALGAIGFAVGALLGSAAPRTRQEDRLMGDTADRMKERATAAGAHAFDQASAALRPRRDDEVDAASDGDSSAQPAARTPAAGDGTTPPGSY